MRCCNAELETQFQKYKGRVVLRGDIVDDDSGVSAVFTEQGSSASRMNAAKVMDVIARLPDCDGPSCRRSTCTHTQVKLGGCSQIAQNPKVRMSRQMDTPSTDMNGPKSWANIEDPVVSFENNLYGHPLAGLLWKRQFVEV